MSGLKEATAVTATILVAYFVLWVVADRAGAEPSRGAPSSPPDTTICYRRADCSDPKTYICAADCPTCAYGHCIEIVELP